jgi:hypothetical protein
MRRTRGCRGIRDVACVSVQRDARDRRKGGAEKGELMGKEEKGPGGLNANDGQTRSVIRSFSTLRCERPTSTLLLAKQESIHFVIVSVTADDTVNHHLSRTQPARSLEHSG